MILFKKTSQEKFILILKEEVHFQTHLWKLEDSRRTICILLEKDRKTPFTNLRSQVENMLVRTP